MQLAVEIRLGRLQLGDLGLQRGDLGGCGISLCDQVGGLDFRLVALCFERVDFSGKELHFTAQRFDVGRCFVEQFGLGLVVPCEVIDLGAGFEELVFECGSHHP